MAITNTVDKMTSASAANYIPRRTNVYWVTSDDPNEDPIDVFAAVNGGSYDLRKRWQWSNKNDYNFLMVSMNVELRQPDTSRLEWVVTIQFIDYRTSSLEAVAPITSLQPQATP